MEAIVSWAGQSGGGALVRNQVELDAILGSLLNRCSAASPLLVVLESHGQQLTVALGGQATFVQIGPIGGAPPYFAAVGDSDATGYVKFMLDGVHHTEVDAKHVILASAAQSIIRHFVQTGERVGTVEWVEI
jgi:hypothetical protein